MKLIRFLITTVVLGTGNCCFSGGARSGDYSGGSIRFTAALSSPSGT